MSPKLPNIIGGTKRKSEDTGNQLPGRAQKAARSGESNYLVVIIRILANYPRPVNEMLSARWPAARLRLASAVID